MLCSSRFLETSVMSKVFQAKTSRVNDDLLLLESVPGIGSHVISRMLPSSTAAVGLRLFLDLTIWNCNMIVLDSGYVLTECPDSALKNVYDRGYSPRVCLFQCLCNGPYWKMLLWGPELGDSSRVSL
ncbi:hypothetical protein Tco_1294138 [Tanacetum coccineum]